MSTPVLFFIIALVVQFTLGVTTLLYAAPITLAALHQIGGFILFSSIVLLANRTLARN
jgi:heme A synthase